MVAGVVEYQVVDDMLDEDLQAPRVSKRARRVITAAFVLNILAVMVLLAVILPAGNKATNSCRQPLNFVHCQVDSQSDCQTYTLAPGHKGQLGPTEGVVVRFG